MAKDRMQALVFRLREWYRREMGLVRLLLALGVVFDHVGRPFGVPLISSTAAVQCFYVVSGFLIAMVLSTGRYRSVGAFYASRWFRLFPSYYLWIGLTVLFGLHLWITTGFDFIGAIYLLAHHPPSASTVTYLTLSQIALIGQELQFFLALNSDGALYWTPNFEREPLRASSFMFMPQAWTLALEIMFYLAAPFFIRKVAVLTALIVGSLAMKQFFVVYGLPADRTILTEIGYFAAGALSYRTLPFLARVGSRTTSVAVCLMLAILVVAGIISKPTDVGWFGALIVTAHAPIILPFCLLLPFCYLWSVEQERRGSMLDRFIGEMSYPVYLSHLLVASIIRAYAPPFFGHFGEPFYLSAALCTLAVAALSVVLVERPITAFRTLRFRQAANIAR